MFDLNELAAALKHLYECVNYRMSRRWNAEP
jgi:hypothetical protein